MTTWSPRTLDGFALAQRIHAGAGPQAPPLALSSSARGAVEARSAELSALGSRQRRRWVRNLLAEHPVPAASQPERPLRALSLLSPHVDRALGQAWLAAAPLPRPGYIPPPDLVRLLRRLAARAPDGAGAAEG